MEKHIYTDSFERMLKEKSDEFKMIPSKRVWHSIYNDLHPSRRWPSVVMSILLIAAVLLAGYLNTENKTGFVSKNKVAGNTQTTNKTQGLADISLAEQDLQNNSSSISSLQQIQQQQLLGNQLVPGSNTNHPTAINNRLLAVQTNRKENNTLFSSEIAPANGAIESVSENNISSLNNRTAGTVLETSGTIITDAVLNDKDESTKTDLQSNNATDLLTKAGNPDAGNNNTSAKKATAPSVSVKENSVTAEQKAWMEAYALHNKPVNKKWKGKLSWEGYITPSLTFRKLSNNSMYNPNASDISPAGKPSLGLEAGGGLVYAFTKNLRLNTGIQLNYTNYNIKAWETNHPVLTTLTLNDPISGYPYLVQRSTSLTTTAGGIAPVKLHDRTYQVSAVVGLDVKLYGNDNIQWYAGASIQPSFIMGGKAYLLSSDHNNFVAEHSMLRKFNLDGGFETFISYKSGNYTWQIGPQVRYQFMSSYDKKYNQKENLINPGVKIGIIKLL